MEGETKMYRKYKRRSERVRNKNRRKQKRNERTENKKKEMLQ